MGDEIVLFLSSEDSLEYFPYNNAFEFTVRLPDPLHLEGVWYCTLRDFQCHVATPTDLYIFSNIIQDSYVRNKKLPILQHVPATSSHVIQNYDSSIRHKLILTDINAINIYIMTKSLSMPSYGRGPSTCTLQFIQDER